jgi:hypothetical protein
MKPATETEKAGNSPTLKGGNQNNDSERKPAETMHFATTNGDIEVQEIQLQNKMGRIENI